MVYLTAGYIHGLLAQKKHPVGATVALHHIERDIRATSVNYLPEEFDQAIEDGTSQNLWKSAVHYSGVRAIEILR